MNPNKIPRKPVTSSHIKSVGYDPTSLTLTVEFFDKAVWAYAPVTMEEYAELSNAPSVGKFFHRNIKINPKITATKVS